MTVNTTTIEGAVKDFQEGNVMAFEELYTLLEGNKWATVRWLRRKTPSAISLSDCYALYDDALYIAASNYCSTGGASFTTYFRNVLNKRRLSLLQYTFSQKRCSESGITNIDTVNQSELVQQCYEDEQFYIRELINDYSKISKAHKLKAMLIIQDFMPSLSAADKYNRMRIVTGLNLSDMALRKRCQRALNDFRNYVTAVEDAQP